MIVLFMDFDVLGIKPIIKSNTLDLPGIGSLLAILKEEVK